MWTQQPWFPRCATGLLRGVRCRACCDHGRSIFSVDTQTEAHTYARAHARTHAHPHARHTGWTRMGALYFLWLRFMFSSCARKAVGPTRRLLLHVSCSRGMGSALSHVRCSAWVWCSVAVAFYVFLCTASQWAPPGASSHTFSVRGGVWGQPLATCDARPEFGVPLQLRFMFLSCARQASGPHPAPPLTRFLRGGYEVSS